jgi:cytidylate kinase
MKVITVSAAYGAGGSVIAPRLAERIGLPFLNRPVDTATTAAISEEARADEDVSQSVWSRILEALASVPDEYGSHLALPPGGSATELRTASEQRLMSFLDSHQGGVVLGYAGALVIPSAFRIRLDGPVDRRLVQGMRIEGLDEATARTRLERTDSIRAGYWKRLYQRDIRDPYNYNLWIDSTSLDADVIVDIVTTAADAFFAAAS